MASYRVPFVSIGGAKYEIRIYSTREGWDAAKAVTLTGGKEPMVTETEKSEDILHGVRGSTGHVNIVTEDWGLLERLIPDTADGMRVTLVRSAKADELDQRERVMWEGYVQPVAYSQDWKAGPWEVQLPVRSRLSMMMDEYLPSGNSGIMTVGGWLRRLCGDVYKEVLLPNNELMKQGTTMYEGWEVVTPTAVEVAYSESIFKTVATLKDRATREDEIWKSGTNRDVADSLLPLLRWVVREEGDRLVVDDPAHINGVAGEKEYIKWKGDEVGLGATTQEATVVVDVAEMTGQDGRPMVSSTDGTMDMMQPMGEITIEGNEDRGEKILIDPSSEAWQVRGGVPMTNGAPDGWAWSDKIPFLFHDDPQATIKSQRVIGGKKTKNIEVESYTYLSTNQLVAGFNYPAGERVDTWYADGTVKDGVADFAGGTEICKKGTSSMVYMNCYPSKMLRNYTGGHGDIFGGGEVVNTHIYTGKNGGYTHFRMNSVVLGRLQVKGADLKRYPALKLKTEASVFMAHSGRRKGYTGLLIEGKAMMGATYKDVHMGMPSKGDGTKTWHAIQVSVKIDRYYIHKDTWGNKECTLSLNETWWDILWDDKKDGQIYEWVRLPMTDGMPLAVDGPVEITIYSPMAEHPGQRTNVYTGNKYTRIDGLRVSMAVHDLPEEWDFDVSLERMPEMRLLVTGQLGSNKLEAYGRETKFGTIDSSSPLLSAVPVAVDTKKRMPYMQLQKIGQMVCQEERGATDLAKRTWAWLAQWGATKKRKVVMPIRSEWPWYLREPLRVVDRVDGYTYMPIGRRDRWRDDETEWELMEI